MNTYAPWVDYDKQADEIRRPFKISSTPSEQIREMVRYATLAANGHNTQPWKFVIKAQTIEIHPDYTRRFRQSIRTIGNFRLVWAAATSSRLPR